ncbi:hypothetical protein U91I_01596 [alpha proteobacterium U9-1i]|nr:hypothetical protein U91I_01596 [alpha proteobacterium U9-1i]
MLDAETATDGVGPLGSALAALLEEGATLAALAVGADEDDFRLRVARLRAAIDDASVLVAAISVLLKRAGYSEL